MNISEAIALSEIPPREHIVSHKGNDYSISLPAHDDGVYYTEMFIRRLERGLIQGVSGILAGAYEWKVV